ncbi:MAG: efflux RND transporter periplasmic adaptor subunit [Thermodesulfobacteriota bacterium]
MRSVSLVSMILLALLAAGCDGGGQAAKTAGKPPVAVQTLAVAPAELETSIQVTGTLAPKQVADLKSEYAGVVGEVLVDQWVRVKKDQPLARLDVREPQVLVNKAAAAVEAAKAQLAQASVARERAQREHQRLIKLKESGLATQQSLDEADSEVQAAAARQAAAQAQLKVALDELDHARTRFAKTVITAPFDGVVAYRGVSAGDLAGEAGAPKVLFRIVDPSLLDLTVTVPSLEMAALRVGQPLYFSTDAFPGRTFAGRVMYINPTVGEPDRSVKVVAEVPNPDEQLKGGLFVKGRIVTGSRQGVLQVPRSALTAWDVGGGSGELWVAAGGRAQRRAVRLGAAAGEMVEVLGGLEPGERIVVRGGFNLRQGDAVAEAD